MPSVPKLPTKAPAGPPGKPTGSQSKTGRHRSPASKGDTLAAAGQVVASHAPAPRSGGRTSVTGKTAKGAVSGAATGAALGSVVPGVGTAVGAGVGAAVGGTAGAVSGAKAKRAEKAAARGDSLSARRILVAEFVVCIIILALSPLSAPEGDPVKPGAWMKKGSAMCGLFLLLGLLASAGRGAAKVASAFGGLVVLVLLVDQRSLFTVLARTFASASADPAPIGPPDDDGGTINA